MESLILLLLAASLLFSAPHADVHTLRYSFTTDSSPGDGDTSYRVVGHVDDIPIVRYNKDRQRVEPLLAWMEEHIDPQHWENQTKVAQYYERRQEEILREAMAPFSHTKDGQNGYTLQVLFSCLISRDNSISSYEVFAANGKNIIALDKYHSMFIALNDNAEEMAESWNSRESSAKRQKLYMEQECNHWFKVYLRHMKELLQPARPKVKVWGRQQPDGVTRLQCLAYGFHPRAVDVRWVRNGEDHIPSDKASPILPHPDGTYQTRVSVEVPTREGDTYSCHVEHSSLEENLIKNLTSMDFKSSKGGSEKTYIEKRKRPLLPKLIAVSIVAVVVIMVIIKAYRLKAQDTGQSICLC
ncbi:major histocompatibility complex class I-related gene protein-like [Hyperolius riggenbachi]|uniref:major histocompatibility complex class I-related gene protein-like n=1 Tax=Hyperolius riggenbachi TaxID=752182 RepID=UPI0035A35AE2